MTKKGDKRNVHPSFPSNRSSPLTYILLLFYRNFPRLISFTPHLPHLVYQLFSLLLTSWTHLQQEPQKFPLQIENTHFFPSFFCEPIREMDVGRSPVYVICSTAQSLRCSSCERGITTYGESTQLSQEIQSPSVSP